MNRNRDTWRSFTKYLTKLKAKSFDSDFIKEHVTDTAYEQIISEVSTRKEGAKQGKKLELTLQKPTSFLYWVSMDEGIENTSILSEIGIKIREKYYRFSPTFVGLQKLAEGNIVRVAKHGVYKYVAGQLPQYYPLVHPETKQVCYIELKEVQPNLNAIMYILDKKKVFDDNEPEKQPPLGAPQNEYESKLLEGLLNKHHDYIQEKKRKLVTNPTL